MSGISTSFQRRASKVLPDIELRQRLELALLEESEDKSELEVILTSFCCEKTKPVISPESLVESPKERKHETKMK